MKKLKPLAESDIDRQQIMQDLFDDDISESETPDNPELKKQLEKRADTIDGCELVYLDEDHYAFVIV